MPGRQAKILSEEDLQDLLIYASATRHPIRNRVIVLLSAKAGLRAGEIASLTWDMVVGPNGAVSTSIELRDHAAKKRSGRLIPLHKDLRDALMSWRGIARGTGPVVLSERGGAMTPLSIVVWLRGRIGLSASKAARPIPGDVRSSPERLGWPTRLAGLCVTFSCLPVTGRSKLPNGTSTATPMLSASSCL
jgi:integrase